METQNNHSNIEPAGKLVNISDKKTEKRTLTQEEKEFVSLCAKIIVDKTLRDINVKRDPNENITTESNND